MVYRYLQRPEADRAFAEDVKNVITLRLSLDPIALHFIEESAIGPYEFNRPILGFCHITGRQIFIRRGLDHFDQARTIAHELRHCWQKTPGKRFPSIEAMERDARLFELELDIPRESSELRGWLTNLERRLIAAVQKVHDERVRSQQKYFYSPRKQRELDDLKNQRQVQAFAREQIRRFHEGIAR